jgi:lambda family phage portal protein
VSDKKKRTGNVVDSMVGFFSPEAGYRRLQFRQAANILARKYEANSTGRRTGGWVTPGSGSANAEIGPALSRVRERVRDLVRNNPNAGKAVSLIESYIVGTGIMSSITVTGQDKRQAQLRAVWKAWTDSTDCDADGLNNFYGLQALAARTVAEAGEALVIRRWRKMSDGYRIPVPFQIQVLEGDFIDTTKEQALSGGGFILQGVQFNKRGQRVGYWLFNQHPGEKALSTKLSSESKFVDAKDVTHLFRVDRSGQVRGMSWGAPCVVRHHDLDAYEDAQLLRQRLAACFAGFVKDIEMPDTVGDAAVVMPEKIDAGGIEILPPGKEIVFPNLPSVSNDGHTERVIRSCAMGWGVTYEGITGDYSRVNYSSFRGTMIDLKRNVGRWQWHMFIPRFNEPVFRWFLEAFDLAGLGSIEGAMVSHTPPRFEMIDPTKEIPAIVTGIRAGLQSLPEAIREQGYDVDEHLAEIQQSNKLLDKLEIIVDSDPRRVMKAGIMQTPTAEELSPPADPAPAAN